MERERKEEREWLVFFILGGRRGDGQLFFILMDEKNDILKKNTYQKRKVFSISAISYRLSIIIDVRKSTIEKIHMHDMPFL